MQDLLPAAAFTALRWWLCSLDIKDLILNIGHVVQDVDGLYSSRVPFHQDCQSTNQAVNIKSRKYIIGFLNLVTRIAPHQHVTCFLSYCSHGGISLCSGKLPWPDTKSGTQVCKISNISVPSVCSVSAMQDRSDKSARDRVLEGHGVCGRKYMKCVTGYTVMSLQRWSIDLSENAEDLIGYSLSEVLLFIKLMEQTP